VTKASLLHRILRGGQQLAILGFATAASALADGSGTGSLPFSVGPAFANEVEDKTLANLTFAPIPRWQIVVPKLLATITIAAPFILLSAFISSYVGFLADLRAVAAVTVAAVVGVALYASAFVWLGLVTTQAIGIGLLYIVLWEGFFSGFVTGVRMLSIRYYAIALMHAMDPRRFATTDHLSAMTAIIMATLVIGGFLLLSVRRLRTMDIP